MPIRAVSQMSGASRARAAAFGDTAPVLAWIVACARGGDGVMPRIQPITLAVAVIFTSCVPSARAAHGYDYPTVDRVEFVLECMQKNDGKQEFLYKCSCVIDELAQKFSYDEFVEAGTAARYQNLGGERGGVFRDPPQTRESAKRYLQARNEAMK